nr:hypothetical protein CFP56_44302 [Quercus suber]
MIILISGIERANFSPDERRSGNRGERQKIGPKRRGRGRRSSHNCAKKSKPEIFSDRLTLCYILDPWLIVVERSFRRIHVEAVSYCEGVVSSSLCLHGQSRYGFIHPQDDVFRDIQYSLYVLLSRCSGAGTVMLKRRASSRRAHGKGANSIPSQIVLVHRARNKHVPSQPSGKPLLSSQTIPPSTMIPTSARQYPGYPDIEGIRGASRTAARMSSDAFHASNAPASTLTGAGEQSVHPLCHVASTGLKPGPPRFAPSSRHRTPTHPRHPSLDTLRRMAERSAPVTRTCPGWGTQ